MLRRGSAFMREEGFDSGRFRAHNPGKPAQILSAIHP